MGRNAALPPDARQYLVTGRPVPSTAPDDTGCPVLHVDMDAFFAAVELRDRPWLATKPVVVAGSGNRSVVTAANYPARKYGVYSAMPLATARRLCPSAVVIEPRHHAYSTVSASVFDIFREVTPLVEPLSLDEAFLDVSGALRRMRASPLQIGGLIRRRVLAAERITCSVGVAASKFIAKLASGMAKPDGMMVVPAAETLAFLRPLPVSALWGVGARTTAALERIGLTTVGAIADAPWQRLRKAVGEAAAAHLRALAVGDDPRPVVADREEKSIGSETTFDVDVSDRGRLDRELLRLAERTGDALRAKGMRGRTISIKVRYPDFHTVTRTRTLPAPTDLSREIYRTALALFDEHVPETALRLLGVRVEGLVGAGSATQQLTFDEPYRGWDRVESAADAVRDRFGSAAMRPASLIISPTQGD